MRMLWNRSSWTEDIMEYTLHDGEKMFMMKLNDIERFDVVVFPAPGGPITSDEPQSLY